MHSIDFGSAFGVKKILSLIYQRRVTYLVSCIGALCECQMKDVRQSGYPVINMIFSPVGGGCYNIF
jgi:hypothetical protein